MSPLQPCIFSILASQAEQGRSVGGNEAWTMPMSASEKEGDVTNGCNTCLQACCRQHMKVHIHRCSRHSTGDIGLLLCGRWAKDRYEGAVAALVHILRRMQATQPDACVLRPVLRDEARKAIGAKASDTLCSLLMHCLLERCLPDPMLQDPPGAPGT